MRWFARYMQGPSPQPVSLAGTMALIGALCLTERERNVLGSTLSALWQPHSSAIHGMQPGSHLVREYPPRLETSSDLGMWINMTSFRVPQVPTGLCPTQASGQ